MTEPDSRILFDRLINAYNGKDVDSALALYSEDFEFWSPLEGWSRGIKSRREHLERLFFSLPDEQLVPQIVVVNGSSVVARIMSTGSDDRGKTYSLPLAMVLDISDGVLVKGRTYVDPKDVARVIQDAHTN